MLDILGFLKKEQPQQPATAEAKTAEPVAEKQVQVDNIAIHVMPERFRHQQGKVNSAKTTGLAIIAGGVVFLIVVSALMYFYLFRKPSLTITPEQPLAAENIQPDNGNEAGQQIGQDVANIISSDQATTTETATLPADNGLATTTATSTQETIEQGINIGLKSGLDSDNDGLTDNEEILLGTSTSTPDTDGDGYLDGAELGNLYDPGAMGKLTANPNIALYENKTFGYNIFYPKSWQSSVNGGDDSVMFKSADNQFIQIIVQPNPDKQPLDQWYMEQLGAAAVSDQDRLSGSDWQGIKNSDGLTLYLMGSKQNYIFTLTYNPGESNVLEYINIFRMMIKSFTLKD